MKVREMITLIESDGWSLDRTRGSYRQFKHPAKAGLVTIAGAHLNFWRLSEASDCAVVQPQGGDSMPAQGRAQRRPG